MVVTSSQGFFQGLRVRRNEPLLRKATGVTRFDIVDGPRTERWLLVIDRGDVRVEPGDADTPVDAVVRTDRATFDRIVAGKTNIFAAVLRGAVEIHGDVRLLVLLQRLFPRPSTRGPVPARERRSDV
jgi:putative sterol carrier protein